MNGSRYFDNEDEARYFASLFHAPGGATVRRHDVVALTLPPPFWAWLEGDDSPGAQAIRAWAQERSYPIDSAWIAAVEGGIPVVDAAEMRRVDATHRCVTTTPTWIVTWTDFVSVEVLVLASVGRR